MSRTVVVQRMAESVTCSCAAWASRAACDKSRPASANSKSVRVFSARKEFSTPLIISAPRCSKRSKLYQCIGAARALRAVLGEERPNLRHELRGPIEAGVDPRLMRADFDQLPVALVQGAARQ